MGSRVASADNTAVGAFALSNITDGSGNTATGSGALGSLTRGFGNTATCAFALEGNTTGTANTAVGGNALQGNITGNNNIAIGFLASGNLTAGDNNIDIGNKGVAGEANTIRIGSALLQIRLEKVSDFFSHTGTLLLNTRFLLLPARLAQQHRNRNRERRCLNCLKPVRHPARSRGMTARNERARRRYQCGFVCELR